MQDHVAGDEIDGSCTHRGCETISSHSHRIVVGIDDVASSDEGDVKASGVDGFEQDIATCFDEQVPRDGVGVETWCPGDIGSRINVQWLGR